MAMFCPVCKVEYRPGFTRCSDCDVALVEHLPTAAPGADRDAPSDAEGRKLLWSGLSVKLYEAIRDALDAAGIAHTDVEKEFGTVPPFTESAQFIWIDPRVREAARSVLGRVLADAEADGPPREAPNLDHPAWLDPLNVRRKVYASQSEPSNPGELAESDTDSEPPDDAPEDFDAQHATSEVWAGEDMEQAQFLKDSLRGVGIGCVLSKDGGRGRVLVLPADEKRAQEIVREVVEDAPPE